MQEPSAGDAVTEGTSRGAGPYSCVLMLVVIVSVVLASLFLPVLDGLIAAGEWLKQKQMIGVVLFLIVGTFWIVICLPSTPLALLAAFTYGFGLGLAIQTSIKIMGSAISFRIATSLGRDFMRRHVFGKHKLLFCLEQAIAKRGFRALFMIQLAYIPLGVRNYTLSVMGVPFYLFITTHVLAELPYTLAFTFTGSQARDLAEVLNGEAKANPAQIFVVVLGVVGVIGAVLVVGYYVKQEVVAMKEMVGEAPSDVEGAAMCMGGASVDAPAADLDAVFRFTGDGTPMHAGSTASELHSISAADCALSIGPTRAAV
jgi:uncharacterized membrane protein YdjX (TVP38/TMEM64 family)